MNNPANNQEQSQRRNHAFSQFEEPRAEKKIHEHPDKTAPDENVEKPVARPEKSSGNNGSEKSIPSPKTKIGFKTPAEEQKK